MRFMMRMIPGGHELSVPQFGCCQLVDLRHVETTYS